MREILFRAKRLDNGEWVEGDLRHGGYANNDSETYIMKSDYALHNIPVDPETVCQFTGLTDKNGVKIFEGDIVRDYDEENEVFVVKYYAHSGYAAFDVEPEINCDCNGLSYLMALGSAEVIGNIFDNPELMGGEIDVHM